MKKLAKGNKASKNSTSIEELSKNRTWQEMMDNESYQLFAGNHQRNERLIFTLYKWSESEDALDLTQFCMQYKIPRQSLYDIRDKYPEVRKAMDNVKLFLGCRKRVGAIKKIYDKEAVFKDMHKYDPEFLEINSYWAALKNIEESPTDKKYTTVDSILLKLKE